MDRKYPPFETRDRIKKWCDIRERCHSEVKKKLFTWGVPYDEADGIIAELISLNFLNEERFARSYMRGKFRINNWGREKIIRSLKSKAVSKYCIAKALEEIEEDDYRNTLQQIIEKKAALIKFSNTWERNQKLLRFAMAKGYAYADVMDVLERQFPVAD